MEFAVITEHPCHPGLMIGLGLPSRLLTHDQATDWSFALFNTFQLIGGYLPGDEPGQKEWLFIYQFRRQRLASITATSIHEALACLDALATNGELISTNAHTS